MPRSARTGSARHVAVTPAVGAGPRMRLVRVHEQRVDSAIVEAAALETLERVSVPIGVLLDLLQLLLARHDRSFVAGNSTPLRSSWPTLQSFAYRRNSWRNVESAIVSSVHD